MANPVCIIHGPFGCGKSTLLVALLHYLLAQRTQAKGPLKGCRILVTAHTNIAVDRVILGLINSGCTGVCLAQRLVLAWFTVMHNAQQCSTSYAASTSMSMSYCILGAKC